MDVLVSPDGSIYVTDAGVHKLIRYDATGRRLLAWDLPVANSIDASHLAGDEAGRVFVTIPEQGQIWIVDPADSQIDRRTIQVDGAVSTKPVGIGVNAEGTIIVAETQGGRVLALWD